ncbi:hypothetical protein CUMW_259610 [Citrus unshiu]|uniref:Uncharacterized protein n=1 Tax=Citrus unshiu TaxID=55188 RepID=A0A2H5QTD3_CITUN|nr:hypothetical protein CUMW_259610 [Citrus unshiu]
MAWSNVSKSLMSQIEQIEGGLRLMVPALIGRIKTGKSDEVFKGVIGEAIKEEMDDMYLRLLTRRYLPGKALLESDMHGIGILVNAESISVSKTCVK